MRKRLDRDCLTLALCVALLPPIWAVLSPYFGIQTGAVALICSGLYAANGNRERDAVSMSLGFLLGDVWAVLTLWLTESLNWHPEIELYLILLVMGGAAVIVSSHFPAFLSCTAWLTGWAIGLTVMGTKGIAELRSYPLQIAGAMLAGIWYVGVFVERIHRCLVEYSEDSTRDLSKDKRVE